MISATASGANEARRIVVVLGMHRSGTSLCAQLLSGMGVDFGSHLLPANRWNSFGYWESIDVVAAHDSILSAFGRHWAMPLIFDPLPPRWWEQATARHVKDALGRWLSTSLTNSPGVFGFKDPRTSRMIPMWLDLFRELKVEPIWVACVRDPRSVAESLALRDGIPVFLGELLWVDYVLEPLRYIRPNEMCFVSYDSLVQDPIAHTAAIAKRLGFCNGRDHDAIRNIVLRHFHPESVRKLADHKNFALELTKVVHSWITSLCRGDFDSFDKTLAELYHLAGRYKRL